jgi:hypothetical protein
VTEEIEQLHYGPRVQPRKDTRLISC